MKESLIRRYVLLASTVIFAVYFLLPSLWKTEDVPAFFMSTGLRLGLDLQGGLHLTMRVAVEEAVKANAESRGVEMASRLKEKGVLLAKDPAVSLEDNVSVLAMSFKSVEDRDRGRKALEQDYSRLRIEIPANDQPILNIRGEEAEMEALRGNAVDRAVEIIRNRIDLFGVSEPVLVREGKDRIVLQLPGMDDEKRALDIIGETAQLEFRIVHPDNANLSSLVQQARASGTLPDKATEDDYRKALSEKIPQGSELTFMMPVSDENKETGQNMATDEPPQPILLHSRTELGGDAVTDARMANDPRTNEPYVHIQLAPRAAIEFEALTEKNVGNQLAIVLDSKVKSAPNIQEKIGGGQVRISGSFTSVEAANLALVLRSGALPAPIEFLQHVRIGASLGADAVQSGLSSGLLGLILVCGFMAFYYGLSGWIADAALMLNNVLLLGVLAAFGATLTLPGIAGIVLTMGMAVDSNVLIFERIREELDIGRPIPNSIRAGFDKAFWTIIDSHVTILITAAALFWLGTGPIRGFAVTLGAGIILNLFTALVGTKVIYDHLLMKSRITRFRFRQLIERPNLDYISARKPAFLVSLAFVVLGAVALVQIGNGNANLGIDFAGGTLVTVSADKVIDPGIARQALKDGQVEAQGVQTAEGEGRVLVRLHEAEGQPGELSGKIVEVFKKAMPDHTFKVESAEAIGSAVSNDLRNASVLAILVSLVGIMFYLAIRFDFRHGIAAAIATFHDVLAVLGFFWISGMEIDFLLVTALLTLAGFSLTDTVVVFDRIRETRNRHESMEFGQIINKSVNEVVSRTIITSTTAFLVLLALYFLGGSVLKGFSLALLIGIVVGTYSSVFVASPILYEWEKHFGRIVSSDEDDVPTQARRSGA